MDLMPQFREMILKALKSVILLLLLATSSARAEPVAPYDPGKEAVDIFVDLVIVRPLALAGTVAGTGLFIGLSPFAGLLSIAPPHDAIVRAANAFIGLPACYAFNPRMGDLTAGQDPNRPPYPCSW